MIDFSTIPVLKKMLINAVVKTARTHSAVYAMRIAERQFKRNAYILKVLSAGPATRAYVRGRLEAAPSESYDDIRALLILFEALSATEKVEFIHTFKACANIVSDGIKDIVIQTVYEPGNVPPHPEP